MNFRKRLIVVLLSLLFILMFLFNSHILLSPEKDNRFSSPNLSNGDHGYNASLGVMLCMDVSSSMTEDMIQQAQEAAYLTLDLFSNDTYIGLVTYARYAYVNVSLNRIGESTHEDDMKAAIAAMVPLPYTNIFGGLMDSIEEFGGSTFTAKHIILMTDGYPNIADPGYAQFGTNPANINTWTTDPDSPIIIANNSNICIHTVGFGSNYDQELLEAIANGTRCGEFYDAGESNELAMAFANIGNQVEGWENEETYYGDISDGELVNITRYYIDDRYPFVRIWITWENPENYTLTIIVKDPNGDNMTAFSTGGNNPPSYSVFNCTGLNYIDIYMYGELINESTLEITSWGNNIASNNEYESYTGGEMDSTYSDDLGIMFCIDVSVSMDSEMVENAKHSAHLILDLISNDTYVGLVTFARYSYVNISLNRINMSTQASDIEEAISSMESKPYTNIYAGLTACIEEFERFDFTSKHIILLSDGLANIADPGFEQFGSRNIDTWTTDPDSPVLIANNSDICISTVGYGDNYDSALLEAIASNTASNLSNGEFYDSSESNALIMFFAELEGWQKQETYNGTVEENETVNIRRYYIDDRYPFIRIWLFWDDTTDCDLEIIVKDHNGDNMTSISDGGQNPPSYAFFNCTNMDYIDIFIYGKMINTTFFNISWVCSIESNEVYIYESGLWSIELNDNQNHEKAPFNNILYFNVFITIYISMIYLVICIIIVFGKDYLAKKERKHTEDNNFQSKSSKSSESAI